MSRWTVGAKLVNVALIGTVKWTQPFLSNWRNRPITIGTRICGALMNWSVGQTNCENREDTKLSRLSSWRPKTYWHSSSVSLEPSVQLWKLPCKGKRISGRLIKISFIKPSKMTVPHNKIHPPSQMVQAKSPHDRQTESFINAKLAVATKI